MMNDPYYKQARLLLRVLPIINEEKDFALKGGTAINFFVRDLSRLSVDIDLTYLPIADRENTLTDITAKLRKLGKRIPQLISDATVSERPLKQKEYLAGLQVAIPGAVIKIEANTIIRGSVFPPETKRLCAAAEDLFELSVRAKCLSVADLFGGKICAALDRQHPRDLFDIKLLFEKEGLTENIRKAFIVYLISHSRPIVELLHPNLIDSSDSFYNEFDGMTDERVSYEQLIETLQKLIREVNSSLTEREREFLITFKRKTPDWDRLGLKGIDLLPAVQWKLINLGRMDRARHREAVNKLEKHLM